MQGFLRTWCAVSAKRNPAVLLDQAALPWFAELNRSLEDRLDDDAFRARMKGAARQLHALATEILERALVGYPQLDTSVLRAAIGAPAAAGGPALLFEALPD